MALFDWIIGYFQESDGREDWEISFKYQADKFSLYFTCNTETLQASKQDSDQFRAKVSFLKQFIYLFLTVLGLHSCLGFSVAAVIRGYSSLSDAGFSLQWLLLLRSTGSGALGLQYLRHAGSGVAALGLQSAGSVVTARGFHCSLACGVFLDQGSSPRLLHQQVDSSLLSRRGGPQSQLYFMGTVLTVHAGQSGEGEGR